MPEMIIMKSWKDQAFWFCMSFGSVAGFVLGVFIGTIIIKERGVEQPTTVHVIIHYQPVEQTHFEQWVGEVAVNELRKGKRSEPGKLSPETIRSIEIHDMFKDGRDPFQARRK